MIRSSSIHFGNAYSPFRCNFFKGDTIRPLSSPEGVADRLRVVAFAELQARDAFQWGAERFLGEAPDAWVESWKSFSLVEDRHAQMLLDRMQALGIDPGARVVSDKLSHLCRATDKPLDFLFILSSAEERGMEAGFILGKEMQAFDATSAAIFQQIAEEEVEHVRMANEALSGYDIEQLKVMARGVHAHVGERFRLTV